MADSSRNKMKWHALEAANHQEKALIHLKRLDELSVERSPIVNEHLAVIVLHIEQARKTLLLFRASL